MAHNPSNDYSTYVFGNDSAVYNTTTTPASGTCASLMGQTQYQAQSGTGLYPQSQQQIWQQQLQQEQEAFEQFLHNAMLYGTAAWRFKNTEPLKPLETRPLSSADRADLEKELPF